MAVVDLLKREIETLKESMRVEYADQARQILTPEELAVFRQRINLLQRDLDLLRNRLENSTVGL